jgi:outer membrane protein OmpA-like peptidoglycan-associated protein
MTDRDRRKKFAFVGIAVALLLLASFFYRAPPSPPPARAAAATDGPGSGTASSPASSGAVPLAVAAPPVSTRERLQFAAGSERLPPEAMDVLARVADAARADAATRVEVSAFQGTSGAEAQLAGRRGDAVRHALAANGVPADRMRTTVLAPPAGDEAQSAGRVELEVK